MTYLRLFWEFFKTGLFSVGGGMATIPFLKEIGASTGWFTMDDLANMIAVSESTPGPIGVNMATYVGFTTGRQSGGILHALLGSVIATLGLITPSIIVILIIAAFLNKFRSNRYVNAVFLGLRPASAALICSALCSLAEIIFPLAGLNSVGSFFTEYGPCLILLVVLLVLTRFVKKTAKWHPIVFILFSAVFGILFQL